MNFECKLGTFLQADVIIIGAGPGGLTAGYQLTKKSTLKVIILETHASLVGGISRTESYKDYHFDIGGHRFFSKEKKVEDLWNELLPHDFLMRPRRSRIYYKGQFYSYPLRCIETLAKLGIIESTRCLISYIKAKLFPLSPVKTFQDWVINNFGARLFNIFFKSYTEKVWGTDCQNISADWAAQRIRGLNLWQAILTAIVRSCVSHSKNNIKTLIENFRYPRRGPGMLWSATAEKIKKQGGQLIMGCKATKFIWNSQTSLWSVIALNHDGQEITIEAKHVISSAPLRDTIPSIHPLPSTASQAARLHYRDFITVVLVLNARVSFNDNWIYVHEPSVRLGRVQNYASWSPDMIPPGGGGCLGLEYFCQEGDAFWSMSDIDLIELAKKEIAFLNLADNQQIIDACVLRQPKAYPVYNDTYEQIVCSVRSELCKKYKNFHMIGRNGMHKYNNQDHAMMTAMLTVENILLGETKYDVWAVNSDAEYHEEYNTKD